MAIILVTYDLKKPGQNYQPVYDYLKKFTWCKYLESVWLLDTKTNTSAIRDALQKLIDANDKVFVVKITRDWAAFNYGCGDWLNNSDRDW